jgi:hypothetical protein
MFLLFLHPHLLLHALLLLRLRLHQLLRLFLRVRPLLLLQR